MKYVIISGSHRKDAQSAKIAQWIAVEIEKASSDHQADIIDLYKEDIPLWDERAWDSKSDLSAHMKPYLDQLTACDALVMISPEWAGMVPGGLKNFLTYFSSKHVAHKPCMLVGVSSSRGGAYPIAELRMSGYKNNRMVYIPDHLIVRDCEGVMNDHDIESGSEADLYIKKRALYSLDVLYAYAKALKPMREENNLLNKDYPFGM